MDIRDDIFRSLAGRRFEACIEADEPGVVAGVERAIQRGHEIGLELSTEYEDGDAIDAGAPILRLVGDAKSLTIAEENLIGLLAKTSGIATATRRLVTEARGRIRIVGGAWKKAPPQTKSMVREAVAAGGADGRMAEHPMVYLDKNYLRLLGGLDATLGAVAHLADHAKVVQITGEESSLADEAERAAALGAATVFVDTGRPVDLKPVHERLTLIGVRERVMLAFGGGVEPGEIDDLISLGADALCIGRSIVDAPLLDLRLRVE